MPARISRFVMTARWRTALAVAVAVLLVAAVTGLSSLPTGASSPAKVVPTGARVEARARVGGARVMLLSEGSRLRLLVAYHRDEGWHGVRVAPPPPRSAAAWAATRGGSGIPALSAVYGRAKGARVKVDWADGHQTAASVAPGGAYLLVRPGHVRSKAVSVFAADGSIVSKVDGP